ncbi:MAG: EAL domain-containing protein, partial [Clostridia bacterium]|nr:EAL domain-containing protein [Clostridia bacterium]
CDINHYKYLIETYGAQAGKDILLFLRTLYKRSLQQGETFGHVEDSQFVLLFHYREVNVLTNRLKAIHTAAMSNANTQKYKLVIDFGIYEVQENDADVRLMISNATLAKKSDVRGVLQNNYKFYNAIFREQYLQEADVEVRMDAALENNEFKVFFQPKLNLASSRIDGCEALVRWYDTEKDYYRPPGTFLPLFEENGFIAKLDKYVYYKVCEFIGNRVSHGLKVYPTSVNISRLTAQLDDFLEYYTTVKRQFQIPDNFITLEFTESVAYENYDLLNRIAKVLHSNGFYCSIDDFGAGYSSFNLLKNMDMDEIKLDRFFIEKGLNTERDKTIWESVINLGNQLNMKVTQEGVETQDITLYLKRIGCHVVQGYYFSKPLTMADYITFIEQSEQEEFKYLDNLGLNEANV